MRELIGEPLCLVGLGVWTRTVTGEMPSAELLNARTRGRASLLTLMFTEVLGQAVANAAFDPAGFATIYGSAFGEMQRLIELLEGMQGQPSEVSPLRFQTSVHNAAAGQISIATKNKHFSTSVAAGRQTVPMGFVEAATFMSCTEERLVLVMGDEAAPPRLYEGIGYAPVAAAFAFCPPRLAPDTAMRLQLRREPGVLGNSSMPLAHNPCETLLPLVAWLNGGSGSTFSLSSAGFTRYCIDRL
jgi:hypothetical protein